MIDAIDRLIRRAAGLRGVISLGGGLPAEAQFPRKALTAAFLEAVRAPGAPALQYGWPEGLEELRRQVAARLVRRGVALDEEDVIITSGAQQAIDIATALVLRPGQRIGVDRETYPAALDLFRTRGFVPSAREDARAVYAMPAVSNPGGRALSSDERERLLARRIAIIEDDAYGELRFDAPPAPPLLARNRSRVLHVGTFSKTLCPGLRVGWLIPPPRLRKRAMELKRDSDLQANSLAQSIVAAYLAREDFDARLTRLRRFYRRRAHRLGDAVARELPSWRWQFPAGGFGLWLEADERVDDVRFLELAIEEGVSFDPGPLFRAMSEPGPTALRVCFSLVPEGDLPEGARRLARAWRRATAARGLRRRAPATRLGARTALTTRPP